MLPVSTLIRNRPEAFLLDANLTAAEAARFFRQHRIGGAPVQRDGHLVGFCSERDVVFRVVAENRDPAKTPIPEIMSQIVAWATVDATTDECEQKMLAAHVRHLPILDHGRVVACLSLRDLLQSKLRETQLEARCLNEYVRGSS